MHNLSDEHKRERKRSVKRALDFAVLVTSFLMSERSIAQLSRQRELLSLSHLRPTPFVRLCLMSASFVALRVSMVLVAPTATSSLPCTATGLESGIVRWRKSFLATQQEQSDEAPSCWHPTRPHYPSFQMLTHHPKVDFLRQTKRLALATCS